MKKSILQLRFRVRMRPTDYTDWLMNAVNPNEDDSKPSWQAWSIDPYTRESSGIYVFETAEDLRVFMHSKTVRELKENPGIVGLNATVFHGLPRQRELPQIEKPMLINALPSETMDYVQSYLRTLLTHTIKHTHIGETSCLINTHIS